MSGESFNAAAWLVDRHVAEGRGDRVAIRCRGASTSYAELQARIWAAQHRLAEMGVAPGDRVAMVMVDDENFMAFFLGALRSGAVPVPLSTMLKGSALGAIVADCGAEALLYSLPTDGTAEITAAAPAVRHVLNFTNTPAEVSAPEAPVAETSTDSQAFWLYSSGTTGTPKGVMHSHGNLRATSETYAADVLGLTEGDRCLSVAKLFFAYGLGNSLTFPLAVGATTILHPDPPTPPAMIALIEAEQPTLFFSSPGFCAAILDAAPDPASFECIRATVTAGESLPANVQTRFADLTTSPVLDGIGSTELLHIFISNTLAEQVPGATGTIVPGYEAELRDDAGAVVSANDTPGYLHVRGPSSATGYWNQPDASAMAFPGDGWVRTGDVYTRSDGGHWTFLGRNNDMIKAGGIWVSPFEVESALIEHESVLEAAVVGSRDDQGLETVVAFVLPASGVQPDPVVLEAHCRERMAAFKRPRSIHVVDELPKTATGKIKRFELRERLV